MDGRWPSVADPVMNERDEKIRLKSKKAMPRYTLE